MAIRRKQKQDGSIYAPRCTLIGTTAPEPDLFDDGT